MKRILLLLTIILAAIPIKSHAVLNTVNIDTVWSFDIKSCTDYDEVGGIRFINDSLADIFLMKENDQLDKYAFGIFNFKNKTISLKHFWPDDSKFFNLVFNKNRSKRLLTNDSTFYVLNSLTLAIEDSIRFYTSIWRLFPTNSDSIVYLDNGEHTLYMTKDTIIKFNYITKEIERFAVGQGYGISDLAVHPDCNKMLIMLSEPHGKYTTDTVMWLNFDTKTTKLTEYNGNRLYSPERISISNDGMYWSITHGQYNDDGFVEKEFTKFYNMSDSLVYNDSTKYRFYKFSRSSSFVIMKGQNKSELELLSLPGFSTMYLDSNWNRGDISDICQGDSLFWSSIGSTIYLNRIGDIQTSIIESKNGTRLYPNPTGNEITIRTDDINFDVEKIKIFDSNGNQIDEYDNKNGSEEIKIDLGRYSNGMYMILLQSKDKSKLYKVIKE